MIVQKAVEKTGLEPVYMSYELTALPTKPYLLKKLGER
jgi:hypothetical protein